jgi:hypothetical protein
MKNYLLILGFLAPLLSLGSIVVMPRVEASLFINEPETNFEKIYIDQPDVLEKAVEWLFDQDKLSHEWTKSIQLDNKFPKYWEAFKDKWHLVDMNGDGQAELIFSGQPYSNDEKEMFSLYAKFGTIWKEIYWDDGHILAYKVHPRTKEVLLYHHRYPCCSQSTHLVNRLRFLNNNVHQMKRYFLARDTGMKGEFFPRKSRFKKNYEHLNKNTMMYWSKGKILADATQFIPTNEIIHFPSNSVYKVLANEDGWLYVQMITPPIQETSKVVNAANLQEVKFFGWIEEH